MSSLRHVAMCALVAFMACAVVSISVSAAVADPPPGKGNPMKGGGKGDPLKGLGKGKPKKGGGPGYDADDATAALVTAGITALAARDIARGYNLVGYKALPPGIQKNLMRGKPLPPGIAKKLVPGGMLGHLPVHPGYEWRIAGRDLILIAIGTAIVADVLHDVFD